jgi:hypothetical protein
VSWRRRNRWWLVLLPVALVVLVAGSSYRVKTFWWDSGYHHVSATAEPGKFVHVVQRFHDQIGPTRRTFDVRLDRAGKVDSLPQESSSDEVSPVPQGATAWRVDLSWRAAPDQDLSGCQVALMDASGAQYGAGLSDPLGQVYPCVPEDAPGPSTPLGRGAKRGQVPTDTQPRPERWASKVVVLMPSGVRPTAARVVFDHPDYVVLPVG